jgi:hypothetical protein
VHAASSSDAHQTLIFLFFVYHEVEVEVYLEYRGTAPAVIEGPLRHDLSKQASHLVSLAQESRAVHATRRLPLPPFPHRRQPLRQR